MDGLSQPTEGGPAADGGKRLRNKDPCLPFSERGGERDTPSHRGGKAMVGESDGIRWYEPGEERDRAIYFIGIRDGRKSCAAGPWNYDVTQSHSVKGPYLVQVRFTSQNEINHEILLVIRDHGFRRIYGTVKVLDETEYTVIAFAEIRLPEVQN